MSLALKRGDLFGWDSKLRKADEFSSVFRFKRVLREAHVEIFYCPNALDFPRLGMVVSKRVLPRAVDRNRVKRVLREAFRLSRRELGGLDVVVRVKRAGRNDEYRSEWDIFRDLVASRNETT